MIHRDERKGREGELVGSVLEKNERVGFLCVVKLTIDFVVGSEDLVEKLVLVFLPTLSGEDFDFAEARKSIVLHDPLVDFCEVATAFAHDASVEKHVGGFGFVIADVIGA